MIGFIVSATALTFLLSALAWDIYVLFVLEKDIPTFGDRLKSGKTASFQLYQLGAWTGVPWLFGCFSLAVIWHAPLWISAPWMVVQGHIYFTMRNVQQPQGV